MFGFLKKCFLTAMTFFSCNALKCVSINNQECKIRSKIIDVNSNEPTFYPYSIEVNKCSDSCNKYSKYQSIQFNVKNSRTCTELMNFSCEYR